MDEEDGRPGPSARKFGPADVLRDVFAGSLCRSRSIRSQLSPSNRVVVSRVLSRQSFSKINRNQFPRLFSGAGLPKAFAPPQVEERHHENVPGK